MQAVRRSLEMKKDTEIYRESRRFLGPVFHSYVSWVLKEAQKRKIQTLYFLARDGYVLQKIAQMLCQKKGISISCRYLYCSRASLRMPSYHLIGEEAYDLIFLGGYHVTVKSFLERAGIPRSAWKRILEETELLPSAREQILNDADICNSNEIRTPKDEGMIQERGLERRQIASCREQLAKSKSFRRWVLHNSRQAYDTAIGYLVQEGLTSQEQIAIVDSGWTGSMQRSLRQLLESAGYSGRITGFYFGLFQKQKEAKDGEYLSWYFSADRDKKNRILFCNNLLECFLSAPHGMTVGYKLQQGQYVPVLKKLPQKAALEIIREQIRGILDGARQQTEHGRTFTKKECGRILHRLMARPTPKEVRMYGSFLFCDDVTEGYAYPLAAKDQEALLKENLLLMRLRKTEGSRPVQLFWPFGTIALVQNPLKRNIYWIDQYISQWLRLLLR